MITIISHHSKDWFEPSCLFSKCVCVYSHIDSQVYWIYTLISILDIKSKGNSRHLLVTIALWESDHVKVSYIFPGVEIEKNCTV